ncbi:hypothetical protein NQ314_012726 [Rhamnusium bicolor]|uniref:Tubulin--tyrosine ligase-like protein 5 n=1 Tax=Rhamnusium bicolor TaxID=1586634 RepID=A0AAV8XAT3_9CUCU|nr:hypothetical protein NQ314_012726 [Rhamnusium bicolor]
MDRIFIVETPNQVPLEEPVVVAKYISNPLLVAGHKCDLRLYVVVTSIDPPSVHIRRRLSPFCYR